MDFGRENSLFPLILIQVKSAAKRTVFGLKDKREKAFLPFKTQLFHIQVVRYAAKEKDITESAGANIAQSAENIDCTASSNYSISSTDFTATGSSSATVSGTTKATIDSSGTTAVAGTIVKLN